jgi:hypothetical protein
VRVTKNDLHAEIRHLRIVIRAKDQRIQELEGLLERIRNRYEDRDKGGFPNGSLAWAMYQDAKEAVLEEKE